MKRTVSALLTAAAMVGCQSPAGQLSMNGHSDAGFSHHLPQPVVPAGYAGSPAAKSGMNPDIVQVGYNKGHGAMQNRTFAQRVGRAVPSHPGMLDINNHAMVPGMGPGMPGCGPGMGMGMGPGAPMLAPRFAIGRSQVRFTKPVDMTIAWQAGESDGGFTPPQLKVPARYNFLQARIYRLKISGIPNRNGLELYPTLEVYPGNVKIDAYLSHNAIPVELTDEDFDQVQAGNYVTKVIYLPDPKFQELAIAGVETLVSTRLDPGVDPVQEAHRRGSILAVVRLGGVDLEMQHSPPLFSAPPAPPAAAMVPQIIDEKVLSVSQVAGPGAPMRFENTK